MTAAKKLVANKVAADFVVRSKRRAVAAVHEVKVGQIWQARFSHTRNAIPIFVQVEVKEIRGKLVVTEDDEGKVRKLELAKFRPLWNGWDLVRDVI